MAPFLFLHHYMDATGLSARFQENVNAFSWITSKMHGLFRIYQHVSKRMSMIFREFQVKCMDFSGSISMFSRECPCIFVSFKRNAWTNAKRLTAAGASEKAGRGRGPGTGEGGFLPRSSTRS